MSGKRRMVAGVPSRLFPPWLETEIAVTPASTARLASSIRVTPLSMNGPPHCDRSQATSSQDGGVDCIHCPYAPKNVGAGSSPAGRFGTVRPGIWPVFSHSASQAGRDSASGARRIISRSVMVSGMCGLPQSLPNENDQSRVAISPTAPALRARSIRAAIASRSPTQYIWKNVCGLAATTSSMGLLANDESPITVPRAAAARATATSPSGCTACTPVGEMITGSDIGTPITLVDISRIAGSPATCGANPSSENAATLSRTVRPSSAPATSAPYTDLGSRLLARRCATATVSNHLLAMMSSLPLVKFRIAERPRLQRALVLASRRVRGEDLHVQRGAELAFQPGPQSCQPGALHVLVHRVLRRVLLDHDQAVLPLVKRVELAARLLAVHLGDSRLEGGDHLGLVLRGRVRGGDDDDSAHFVTPVSWRRTR